MPKGKAITALVDTVVSMGIKIKTQETVQWWYRPCEGRGQRVPLEVRGGTFPVESHMERTGPILSPLSLLL